MGGVCGSRFRPWPRGWSQGAALPDVHRQELPITYRRSLGSQPNQLGGIGPERVPVAFGHHAG